MFLSKGLAVAGSTICARNSTCDNCVRSHSGTSDKSQKDKSSPGLLLTSHRQQNVLVRQDRCKSNSATIHSQSPRNSDTAKCIFPQQRKLGVFSHSKGSGAGRSSQIRWEPGSGEGSGEEFPFTGESLGAARSARRKVGNRVPSKRFPSKVPRNRFPSNGS